MSARDAGRPGRNTMWQDLITALALLLVLEGILPFASPHMLRRMMFEVAQLDDRVLRIGGLLSMLSGLLVLYFISH